MYRKILLVVAALAATGNSASAWHGTKTIYAKALDDHGCNPNQWGFVITQIDEESKAPDSIRVEWANGSSEDVDRSSFTGKTAHYNTSANLDSEVSEASAEIYSDWHGEFNLSHGPCPPPPTETPIPTETEIPTETATAMATETPTVTNTPTLTATGTLVPSNTPTNTSPSPSATPTSTRRPRTPTPTGTVMPGGKTGGGPAPADSGADWLAFISVMTLAAAGLGALALRRRVFAR